MKWRKFTNYLLREYGDDKIQKMRSMKLCCKWNRLTTKLLKFNTLRQNLKLSKLMWKYLKLRQLKIYGKFSSMAHRYLALNHRKRRIKALGKWSSMARKYLKFRSLRNCKKWYYLADRLLCRYDREHRRKRVDERWLRLGIKYQAKHHSGMRAVAKLAM
jgi:hypothetical protein